MAPKSSRVRAGPGTKPRRGREHNRNGSHDGVANVYSEMLSDTGASIATTSREERRPLKRRRIAGTAADAQADSALTAQQEMQDGDGVENQPEPMAGLQTITDDSESSESEFEWEDVGIDSNDTAPVFDTPHEEPERPLEIVIGGQPKTLERRAARKRRPITSAEKSRRVDVHKMHISYLLYHCFYRNSWCNDQKSQACLQIELEYNYHILTTSGYP
jgi:xeroderma pigmentosum group C-complementing protein